MALINCPECNKEISDKAKACPNCGYQLVEENSRSNSYVPQKPKKKKGCLKGIGIWIIILIILIILGKLAPNSAGDESNKKLLAYNYAQNFVKENLKSPSTAKFPRASEKDSHTKDLGDGKFEINSWVESQNSFGATIRTRFSCVIIFEGDNVSCENLVIK